MATAQSRSTFRVLVKLAAAYVIACLPWTIFISTLERHGPLVTAPEAVMYGLRLPIDEIVRVIQGRQKDIWLSLIFFWPLFLTGLLVVGLTERSRLKGVASDNKATHDA
jgi:hypothetical protein